MTDYGEVRHFGCAFYRVFHRTVTQLRHFKPRSPRRLRLFGCIFGKCCDFLAAIYTGMDFGTSIKTRLFDCKMRDFLAARYFSIYLFIVINNVFFSTQ